MNAVAKTRPLAGGITPRDAKRARHPKLTTFVSVKVVDLADWWVSFNGAVQIRDAFPRRREHALADDGDGGGVRLGDVLLGPCLKAEHAVARRKVDVAGAARDVADDLEVGHRVDLPSFGAEGQGLRSGGRQLKRAAPASCCKHEE